MHDENTADELTFAEVMKFFAVPADAILAEVEAGTLYRVPGHPMRFLRSDIEAFYGAQRVSASAPPRASGPTSLYRAYDTDGALLYVGITSSGITRFAGHAYGSKWWPRVRRLEIVHFATREQAEAAERQEIKERRPLHNVAHAVREGDLEGDLGKSEITPHA